MSTKDPYPTDPARPAAGSYGTDLSGAPVGQVMSEIATDMSTLVRKEIELAKAEITQEGKKAGKAAGMLGGATYAGHFVLLFGTLAAVFGIASQLSLGWAALIMTGVWAVVATVLWLLGRDRLRRVRPKPELTMETLKEDAEWARHPSS